MEASLAPAQQPTRLVRKSAFGRTQLFLPSMTTLIREIKCMGDIQRYEDSNVFHTLPPLDGTKPVSCWHCCEPVKHMIPLPRLYDPDEKVYHVYGATCSPGCAKAYILEHTTFDRGQHLDVLIKMLRDLYGVHDHVFETPPRAALSRFGGPFDPSTVPTVECRLVQPPFVSYCMIAQERAQMELETSSVPSSAAPTSAVPMDTSRAEEADVFETPFPDAEWQSWLPADPSPSQPAPSTTSSSLSTARPPAKKQTLPKKPPPASKKRPAPDNSLLRFAKKPEDPSSSS